MPRLLNWQRAYPVSMISKAHPNYSDQLKREFFQESLEQLCCDKVRLKIIARKILRNVVEPNLERIYYSRLRPAGLKHTTNSVDKLIFRIRS